MPTDREETAEIAQCWPEVPRYARNAILDMVRHYATPTPQPFVYRPDATAAWDHLEIVVTSPQRLKLTVRGEHSTPLTFDALGLRGKLARTFIKYARLGDGPLHSVGIDNKHDVSRLRKWLVSAFGMPGDPFYRRPRLRRPRFKISAPGVDWSRYDETERYRVGRTFESHR